MQKLPISIGILGWNTNNSSLPNTMFSYLRNRLFEVTDDITIFFQEIKEEDIKLANYFNIKYIGNSKNVGIANAFNELATNAKYENFLILEHDWYLQENAETTFDRIKSSINMVDNGYDCVKLRSMIRSGFPDFALIRYMDDPLNYFDEEMQLSHPHLLDTCHMHKDIHLLYPDKIKQVYDGNCMYYTSSSRYGNYTNNPCIYKTKFFKKILEKFAGEKDSLEGLIAHWWPLQNFKIAHSQGLFTHFDIVKYAPYWDTINYYAKERGLLK
jgi:hypothetical protein